MAACFKKKEVAATRTVAANDAPANAQFATNVVTNTKYTWYNFVPKNLGEQFSRAMNRYFLIIACLQLIPQITPVNALTTWVPLAVIFAVTAIKEAVDDWGRMRADQAANSRAYSVLRDGALLSVPSRDILVGDIIKLVENDEVPADVVLLSSADANGNAFIQTTNLDGESNLKVRSSLPATKGLVTEAALSEFRGVIVCPAPNEDLAAFDSQLRLTPGGSPVLPLTPAQLLLQATHVRNTAWLWGVVVYTGNETKFGKNKKTPPTKYTQTDGFINGCSAVIFGFQLLLVAIFGGIGDGFTDNDLRAPSPDFVEGAPQGKAWYMAFPPAALYQGYEQLIIPARFLLLNSTMIPISLKLTLDLCKLFYAKFIDADIALYDPESDTPAHSNSTALSEDLGQVKYVLTDKTGTLTDNRMVLKVAVIGGKQFGSAPAGGAAGALSGGASDSPAVLLPPSMPACLHAAAAQGIMADPSLFTAAAEEAASAPAGTLRGAGPLEFLRCLGLNNDVVPSLAGADAPTTGAHAPIGGRLYKASSPDEEALVKAAAAYGASLSEREGDVVRLALCLGPAGTPGGAVEEYVQLAAFEFSSDRKRMSVLLRSRATGRVRLYCKGADDMVMARLAPGQEALVASTQALIDGYAEQGLRTLVYAFRDVTEEEYAAWRAEYDAAAASLVDREAAKERVYAMMERSLVLLGATAIEDKLQDGVPETIALLRQAGVCFWMLTGDKFSTALTIAHTAALKLPETELVTIEGDDVGGARTSVDAALRELRGKGHNPTYELAPTVWQKIKAAITRAPAASPAKGGAPASAAGAAKAGPAPTVSANPLSIAARTSSGSDAAASPRDHTSVTMPLTLRGAAAGARAPYTVIVRGATLTAILGTPGLREDFAAICCGADSVICCRVSPKQKGALVKLVKDAGHATLAIGDGGNDVAMIQEAGVGVGIRGKEGLQAARAADYQVTRFRALQRLLLIHGRYSYVRTCTVAQYSFHKSLLFCFMQIGFGFFSGFGGVSLFNSLCVAAYNAVLFVPIVFFLLDRDITQETALSQPAAYKMCSNGDLMTARTFLGWSLRALWQAIVLLLFCLYGNSATRSADYESLGLLVFMAYMLLQDSTMLFALRRVNWRNTLSVFAMHALAFIVGFATNATPSMRSFIDTGSFTNTLQDPSFWLTQLLTAVACAAPVQFWAWWNAAYADNFAARLYRYDSQ